MAFRNPSIPVLLNDNDNNLKHKNAKWKREKGKREKGKGENLICPAPSYWYQCNRNLPFFPRLLFLLTVAVKHTPVYMMPLPLPSRDASQFGFFMIFFRVGFHHVYVNPMRS
jgi:hypothetical protein